LDLWVGIDPGKRGAIAAVDHRAKIQHCLPLEGDPKTLHEWLTTKNDFYIRHVFLEKAQSLTGQGVRGIFTYAEEYGILQGILITTQTPYTLIPPQKWQKTMFVGTKAMNGLNKRDPKERALEAANRVFTKKKSFWLKNDRCKKPHDGMVDAALLAEACRRAIG
jgi:hypothetical protein